MGNKTDQPKPGYRYVYCKSYRHFKTKQIVRASDCGKKFFRFEVKDR